MLNRHVVCFCTDRAGALCKEETEVAFLKAFLETVVALCGFLLALMMIYQLFLGIFGFRRKKKDYEDHDPQSRFLVLVPAHNEEKVIGDICRNLEEMDYPRELYDYYIIADNCSDATAEKARALGAKVIETRKESPDAPTASTWTRTSPISSSATWARRTRRALWPGSTIPATR